MGRPGPGDQDRAARRLLGGRVRRRVRAGHPRGPPRLRAGRGRRPSGLPPLGRVRRRPDPRPVPADRQGADDRAARRGDHGRRQRRHPLPAAPRSRCGCSRPRCSGSGRPAPRWSWAPAPTSAPSSRSLRRSSRSPGSGRAGSPRPRRSRPSRPADGPSRSGRCSVPSSPRTPALFFGPDRFHPSAAGYSTLAAVLLPSVLAAVGVIPVRGPGARGGPRRGDPADLRGRGRGRPHPRHRDRRHPDRPARPAAPGAAGSSCAGAAASPSPTSRPRSPRRPSRRPGLSPHPDTAGAPHRGRCGAPASYDGRGRSVAAQDREDPQQLDVDPDDRHGQAERGPPRLALRAGRPRCRAPRSRSPGSASARRGPGR